MGFRADLDLRGFLKDYQSFIEGKAGYKRPLTQDEKDYYATQSSPTAENTPDPRKWGHGPEWCSTETGLIKVLFPRWDVNGYYSHLGVSPDATRVQLRDAYLTGGHANDPRSAYILKQLLNPEIRAEYDSVRLGDQYMDEYVQSSLKAAAIAEAARRRMAGGLDLTPEAIMNEWGLTLSETSLPGSLDNEPKMGQPRPLQDQFSRWDYSFYLWRSGCQDTERLARWQSLIVSALAKEGESVRLRLGYVGNQDHPYVIGEIGQAKVIFLNDSLEPNESTADSAAGTLIRELTLNKTPSGHRQAKVENTNMSNDQKPKFRTGGEAAEQADADARKGGGVQFSKIHYFKVDHKNGVGKAVVRMLTDNEDWVFVKQHQGVKTKNKPADYVGKWPEALPAVCRYSEISNPPWPGAAPYTKENPDPAIPEWIKFHDDCYICDTKMQNMWGNVNKATLRIWALAVLRDEVLWTAQDVGDPKDGDHCTEMQVGRVRGYKDAVREVTIPASKDGTRPEETKEEIAIVVMNQAMNNFFNSLQSAYNHIKSTTGVGTVCDRDYVVSRKGEEKETEYNFFPLEPTPNLRPGLARWDEKYTKAIIEQGLDLEDMVADRCSDEYYARMFDPTKTVEPRSEKASEGAPATQQVAAPSNDVVDPAILGAMRERVRQTSSVSAGDVD